MSVRMASQSRLEILFICCGDPWSGAPHQMMSGVWLKHRGYTLRCVVEHDNGKQLFQTPIADLEIIPAVASGKHRHTIARQGSLARSLLRYRCEASNRNTEKRLYYVVGSTMTPASLVALAGVPRSHIVYHTQDFLEPGRHPYWEFFERRFAKKAGLVVCNEVNRARFMASHYRLSTVPLVVRTALPKAWPAPKAADEARRQLRHLAGVEGGSAATFLMAGGPYSEVRQSAIMIRTLRLLPKDYYLVFPASGPGSPSHRTITQAAASEEVLPRIVFLGHLSHGDLLNYMAACDAGFLLYANDGIGNYYQCPGRLAEYLLVGLPMVMSDFPSFELLALKHRIGVTCDGYSPESVAAAVRGLLHSPVDMLAEMRRRIVHCGRNALAYDNDALLLEENIHRIFRMQLPRQSLISRIRCPAP